MRIEALSIPEVKLIVPHRHTDDRGYLSEVYRHDRLHDAGIEFNVVQENHSYSRHTGTVRGLHYQLSPRAQAKLVRVVRGRIYDVAVDLRRGSPTFGEHVTAELSAEGGEQLFVPAGFAHGFCTLEPATDVVYLLDEVYSPEHERGLFWNDPALGIDWPVPFDQATLSERDLNHPPLDLLEERDLP